MDTATNNNINTNSNNKEGLLKGPSCDYEALQTCLKKNNGDRMKCLKEWEEFKVNCSKGLENKKE